jgi:hypothetical protein
LGVQHIGRRKNPHLDILLEVLKGDPLPQEFDISAWRVVQAFDDKLPKAKTDIFLFGETVEDNFFLNFENYLVKLTADRTRRIAQLLCKLRQHKRFNHNH